MTNLFVKFVCEVVLEQVHNTVFSREGPPALVFIDF